MSSSNITAVCLGPGKCTIGSNRTRARYLEQAARASNCECDH